MKDVLVIIMAGGKGKRLMPLTQHRSKPAIPFGGIYLLIDLALSNCINSQLYKIIVLPQYKSQTLMQHLEGGWNIFSQDMGHFLKIVPPQMLAGEKWYEGTADSIRQNLYLIEQEMPEHILILSGDHVYKMDYTLFKDYHVKNNADVTISVMELSKEIASDYGILGVDKHFRINEFQEKPTHPATIPGDENRALGSMGIYIFKTRVLIDILKKFDRPDFGKDIIPNILTSHRVMAYPYRRENKIRDLLVYINKEGTLREKAVESIRDSGYWRDVGTLDAYWNANMDLTGVNPYFNLYGRQWPLRTFQRQYPPAKTVFAKENDTKPRAGKALDSLVAHGSIISGAQVRNSVISYNVFLRSWSLVEESVIMENVIVGRHCRIKKAIITEGTRIPNHTEIGYNPKKDQKHL